MTNTAMKTYRRPHGDQPARPRGDDGDGRRTFPASSSRSLKLSRTEQEDAEQDILRHADRALALLRRRARQQHRLCHPHRAARLPM